MEGGVEMGTSTADIPPPTERRKSGSDEVNVTLEMNNGDVNESQPSALQNGSLLLFSFVSHFFLSFFLSSDENNEERDDDEENAGEQ